MIRASRYYKMYSIWTILTNPNEYLLDRGLGLVAKGRDWDIYVSYSTKSLFSLLQIAVQ